MHPRLLRTLAHIQRRFGNRRIEVISGFRAPADGDELNSYHQVGRAVDLRIAGVSKEDAEPLTLAETGFKYGG